MDESCFHSCHVACWRPERRRTHLLQTQQTGLCLSKSRYTVILYEVTILNLPLELSAPCWRGAWREMAWVVAVVGACWRLYIKTTTTARLLCAVRVQFRRTAPARLGRVEKAAATRKPCHSSQMVHFYQRPTAAPTAASTDRVVISVDHFRLVPTGHFP